MKLKYVVDGTDSCFEIDKCIKVLYANGCKNTCW